MDADDEMSFIDVPEQPREDLMITVPVLEERTSDEPQTWAERVANEDNPSHTDARVRPAYPAHLLSEVNAFDGVLPGVSLILPFGARKSGGNSLSLSFHYGAWLL